MQTDYTDQLRDMVALQQRIQDIHPCFCHYFPIAVMDQHDCQIYDWIADAQTYQRIREIESPLPRCV